MALMTLVAGAAFTIYQLVQNSYTASQAQFELTRSANLVVTLLEQDLRSSTVPNGTTPFPVRVITVTDADGDNPGIRYLAGQRLDIYVTVRRNEADQDDGSINITADRYKRVRYSVEADGSLRRGWVRQTGAPSGSNPRIANISNWRLLAVGMSNAGGTAVPAGIFSDTGSPAARAQRLISISCWLKDTQNTPPRVEPIMLRTRVLSGY